MTTDDHGSGHGDRRLTPADVHSVMFSRAPLLRPGYNDVEVSRFLDRVGKELTRLIAEKAELRDQVHAVQAQLSGVATQEAPTAQAVSILSTAQQTADQYVAEAEDFSRQVTSEARELYEDQLRQAREKAGAIIQAAQEAAASIAANVNGQADGSRSAQELQDQVVYLQAFGQACRVQLRSYLEALISDVEIEWGRADPACLPQAPLPTPAQRPDRGAAQAAPATVDAAGGAPRDNGAEDDRADDGGSEVIDLLR